MSVSWPSLPNRPAADQPDPTLRSVGLSYSISGKYKSFFKGHTAFSSGYDLKRCKLISLVDHDTTTEAEELFDSLAFCKGEYTIPTYFVDNTRVVIGYVRVDVFDFFKSVYHKSREGTQSCTWWETIGPKFCLLIGDICKALIHLISLRAYCGSVVDASVVKLDSKGDAVAARLAAVKKVAPGTTNGGYRNLCIQDLEELRLLITKILMIPFDDWDGSYSEALLTRFEHDVGAPAEVMDFIKLLGNPRARQNWDLKWILDHSFHWSSHLKWSFIRKLHSRAFRMRLFRNLDCLDGWLDELMPLDSGEHWSSFIPADLENPVRKVFNHKEAHYRRLGVTFRDFLGLVIFFRNMLAHYNDYAAVRPDEEVVEIADAVITGGICWRLRGVLGKYFWWLSGRLAHEVVDPSFFLSSVPF